MKNTKSPIFFRYEFSDETGRPEGGDVFKYPTHAKVQSMVKEILKVAHSDQVTVNLTIGFEKPFFGFLKNSGLNRQDVEKEMVLAAAIAAAPKTKAKAKSKSKKEEINAQGRTSSYRRKTGPDDLSLVIQDKTFDYLMISPATEIRVSAYLDQDWPTVRAMYEELFVAENCGFESKVTKVIPGSKERKGIVLPGAMEEGEQLTILVSRTPIAAASS